jgi:hypothetical protein
MDTSIVFHDNYIRKHILSFIINKRCISCHNILLRDKEIDKKPFLYYRNDKWNRNQNKKCEKVCNWCYYYVWEYR